MDSTYSTTYTTTTTSADPAALGAVMAIMGIFWLVTIAVSIIQIVALWKLFTKAGKPGWAAIVPFYNVLVMCEIAGRPAWWLAMMFIPIANIIFGIMLTIDFVKSYGKDMTFAVLTVLFSFIMLPIMAFDKNTRYVGPAGPEGNGMVPPAQPLSQPPVPPTQPPVPPVQ